MYSSGQIKMGGSAMYIYSLQFPAAFSLHTHGIKPNLKLYESGDLLFRLWRYRLPPFYRVVAGVLYCPDVPIRAKL